MTSQPHTLALAVTALDLGPVDDPRLDNGIIAAFIPVFSGADPVSSVRRSFLSPANSPRAVSAPYPPKGHAMSADTNFDPPPPDWLTARLLEEAERPPAETVTYDAGHAFSGASAEEVAEARYEDHLRGPVVIRREVQR